MIQNLKRHACGECNFSTSRKFNLERHFKRKHQNQHHQPVQAQEARVQQQGGRVQVRYQQHDRKHAQVNNQQEQQTGEQHPLDAVHHQPIQAQQAWEQQQDGRVRVLCHKHAQVNNQPQYKCYM